MTPKKPPTFRHLPLKRAKVLKKKWVETQKIRSKWKLVKRREGLVKKEEPLPADEDSGDDDEGTEDEDGGSTHEEPAPQTTQVHPSRMDNLPSTSSTTNEKTPLRDLAKEAYSRSSLHTFKSDPFHRRRQPTHRGRGRGMPGGRGRGQPNMKLRMDVLLEKIKRDFT